MLFVLQVWVSSHKLHFIPPVSITLNVTQDSRTYKNRNFSYGSCKWHPQLCITYLTQVLILLNVYKLQH